MKMKFKDKNLAIIMDHSAFLVKYRVSICAYFRPQLLIVIQNSLTQAWRNRFKVGWDKESNFEQLVYFYAQLGIVYRNVLITSPSRLEANAGFFRFYMKGKFDVYRKVASSSTPRLVARLDQQHTSKGQNFKQQHVLVSSNKYLCTPYLIQANGSNLIQSHLFFLPECRIPECRILLRIPIRFFPIFIYERHLQECSIKGFHFGDEVFKNRTQAR